MNLGTRRGSFSGEVGVIGLGLIGGSLVRSLHEQGVTVCGYDTDPRALQGARNLAVPTATTLAGLCAREPAVVVLAVPLPAMAITARNLAGSLPPTVVITDVGSVKAPVRSALSACGLADRYIGAHPMAGTEHSGFAASRADLLAGARWAVTIDESSDADNLLTILEMVTGPLRGSAQILDDDTHDEATALISHVPHVLATELLNLTASTTVRDVALGLAAGSFRDGTRVARTDPRRTEAMVVDNAGWVAAALRRMIRDMEELVQGLEEESTVAGFFDRGNDVRTILASPPDPVEGDAWVLEGRWQQTLVAGGRRGDVVTAVDRDARTVRTVRYS